MIILPPGIHYGISTEEYRAQPGLSQSTIKAFGNARTPAHFKYGLENPKDETPSLRIGNYVDCAVYSPQDLADKFTVWPKRRQGAEWEKFRSTVGHRTILNEEEHSRATCCLLSLSKHEDSTRIIKACHKQVVVIAHHPSMGLMMKGCLDLDPDRGVCHHSLAPFTFDIKTSEDASPAGFSNYCHQFGYHIQAAYYMDLLNLNGVDVQSFGFIVVENVPPYGVAIHYINKGSPEYIRGVSQYEDLMLRYTRCWVANNWPGYGDEWTQVRFKPWQLRDSSVELSLLE